MGLIEQLLTKVNALTAEINQIKANAKENQDFPAQSVLDVDSKIRLTKDRVSSYITPRQLIEAINSGSYNKLLNIGNITVVDNVITIPSGASWKINNVVYTTTSDTNITVPYTSTGYIRQDIIVANDSGQLVLIQGQQATDIPIEPVPPSNTIYVTALLVSDSSITDPVQPSTLDETASHFKGDYNPTTHVPILSDTVGKNGDYYKIISNSTRDFGSGNISLKINDYIQYNGFINKWEKFIDNNQTGGGFGTYELYEEIFIYNGGQLTVPQGLSEVIVIVDTSSDLNSGIQFSYNTNQADNNITFLLPYLDDLQDGASIKIKGKINSNLSTVLHEQIITYTGNPLTVIDGLSEVEVIVDLNDNLNTGVHFTYDPQLEVNNLTFLLPYSTDIQDGASLKIRGRK